MAHKLLAAAMVAGTLALATGVAPAWPHQIASSNKVTVQVHVDPNDEPIAGTPTTVWVVRVKALNAVLTWRTCRCRLSVFDSSGTVLHHRAWRIRAQRRERKRDRGVREVPGIGSARQRGRGRGGSRSCRNQDGSQCSGRGEEAQAGGGWERR